MSSFYVPLYRLLRHSPSNIWTAQARPCCTHRTSYSDFQPETRWAPLSWQGVGSVPSPSPRGSSSLWWYLKCRSSFIWSSLPSLPLNACWGSATCAHQSSPAYWSQRPRQWLSASYAGDGCVGCHRLRSAPAASASRLSPSAWSAGCRSLHGRRAGHLNFSRSGYRNDLNCSGFLYRLKAFSSSFGLLYCHGLRNWQPFSLQRRTDRSWNCSWFLSLFLIQI